MRLSRGRLGGGAGAVLGSRVHTRGTAPMEGEVGPARGRRQCPVTRYVLGPKGQLLWASVFYERGITTAPTSRGEKANRVKPSPSTGCVINVLEVIVTVSLFSMRLSLIVQIFKRHVLKTRFGWESGKQGMARGPLGRSPRVSWALTRRVRPPGRCF